MKSSAAILVFVLLLCALFMCVGCTKPAPVLWSAENGTGPFLRVQSSYGDMQQVEVRVLRWVENGQDASPFDRRTTPFDIPVGSATLEIQFRGITKGPELKVLHVNAAGKMVAYVQSTQVCIVTDGNAVTLKNCKAGLL